MYSGIKRALTADIREVQQQQEARISSKKCATAAAPDASVSYSLIMSWMSTSERLRPAHHADLRSRRYRLITHQSQSKLCSARRLSACHHRQYLWTETSDHQHCNTSQAATHEGEGLPDEGSPTLWSSCARLLGELHRGRHRTDRGLQGAKCICGA